MKPKTAMEKNSIREWISVILPVLIWLLLRYAGRNLPPAAQIGLTGFLLVVATFLYVREKGLAAFRMSGRDLLLWTGVGLICGLLNRFCFGKSAEVSPGVPAFLLVCVLGPITEEILYRGLVYEHCLRFLPVAGAILLNSLLFGLAHGSPVQMLTACVAGILLSLARKKTGTVLAAVLMHMAMNILVAIL